MPLHRESEGRIIELDEFSGDVLVTVGSRFFYSLGEILWVSFSQETFL